MFGPKKNYSSKHLVEPVPASHMRSVRTNDMIRQLHLRDRFLKAQGTSAFAIVNPECPIRPDKVTNHLHVRRIQYRTTTDSWRFLPDVISRLKCNLCDYEIPFFYVYSCHMSNFKWLFTSCFLKSY